MSKTFAVLNSIVVGYLNGAGLGALSLGLLPNYGVNQPQAPLLALLVIGPLGALLGLMIAVGRDEAKKTRGA